MNSNQLKKIIRESIYRLLNEYSSEQRLPFDDDKFKNKNYLEQYTDWLEDFGKYGKLPPSKANFWDELRKAIQIIIDDDLKNRKGHSLDDYNDIEHSFNVLYKERIGPYLQFNSDGNIYVERAVQIRGSAFSYNDSDENGKDPMQLYNSLVKNYNHNVGGCWAFREGKAEAYCSDYEGDIILLRGYIRVEDIDMIKTALLNYNCDEFEIRVKPNAKVELFEGLFFGGHKKYNIPLRGTLVVSASYFGNNGKYHGEYAPIDDGFGRTHTFMDREGNIHDSLGDMIRHLLSQGKSIDGISDSITPIGGGLYKLLMNSRFTIVDKYGNLFDDGNTWLRQVGDVHDGCAAIQRDDGKWSFINSNNQQIGDWYHHVQDFHDGVAIVFNDDRRCTLINTNGEQLCKWYRWIESVDNGLAIIQQDDKKWIIFNIDRQQICGLYDYIEKFDNGFARAQRNDLGWTFINIQGNEIGGWYEYVTNFHNGFARVENDEEQWALINTKGKQICKWYCYVEDFYDGLARVYRKDEKCCIINTLGQEICKWYNKIEPFFDNVACVQRDDGKISYINTDGNEICNWYNDINFHNGLGYVIRDDGKVSLIDKQFKEICGWYKNISPFNKNTIKVQRDDDKVSLFNLKGQQVTDWFHDIKNADDGVAMAEGKNEMWTFIDSKGRQRSNYFVFRDGEAEVVIDGKRYRYDMFGDWYDENGKRIKNPLKSLNEKAIILNKSINEALNKAIHRYLLYK